MKINAAIIGTGIGIKHLEAIEGYKKSKVLMICEKDKKKIFSAKIYYVEADYIWGRPEKLFQWRSKIKDYSITLGAGIHMIDLVMWILKSKPLYVQAFGNNLATKKTAFSKKSFALYVFQFPNNVLVKVTSNAASTYEHFHELKIFEKNRTLIHSYSGSYLFEKKNKETFFNKIKNNYPDKENRKKLIQNFIDSLLNNKTKEIVSFKEQVDLMTVCFASDKSLRSGKKIKISYL